MDLPSIVTPPLEPYSVGTSVELHPERDPDAIKLFIGQVPKTFEEKDLKPYLDPYGPIYELSILRDKLNSSHKGNRILRLKVCFRTNRNVCVRSLHFRSLGLQLNCQLYNFCRLCICDILH